MARQIFTNRNVIFAPPGRHHAGIRGLYLYVSPDAQVRRWIFRYTSPVSRRVTETGLGLFPAVAPNDARSKALDLQKQIAAGICPITARRAQRAVVPLTQTFGECCEAWIKTHEPGWRGVSQLRNAKVLLFGHGCKLLVVPVASITANTIQATLTDLWVKYPSQARRALAMFGRVLAFANARAMRAGDNPAAWRGNMEYRFPRQLNIDHKHYSAMDYVELPGFLAKLRRRQVRSAAARALEFLILTAARTGEVLNMAWEEVDWDNKVWTLGAMRTKQGRVHRVPLSGRAMELLAVQHQCRYGSPYVFLGNRKQLSGKSMVWVLRDMGQTITVHGFRSTFRNWAGDETEFQREHVEECLGHAIGNATERAYRRSDALEKRRVILQAWAEYCHDHR
jgi:integrase